MQFVAILFLFAVGVFIIYYLPLVSRELNKATKQNEVIIKLLEKSIDKDGDK
ncbi:hypothetical protein ACQCWA_23670 [Rossellomorea aquimaris]|jgi:hypothetical protein|uniref:hypothetical protein n=1 Tax=Rossellomorea aquimaris TaxID=189382 RepID=UPI003CEA9A5F